MKRPVWIFAIVMLTLAFTCFFWLHSIDNLESEDIPLFVSLGVATIIFLMLGIGSKYFFARFVYKEECRRPDTLFVISLSTIYIILLATAVYYIYSDYPDFAYGWIFNVATIPVFALIVWHVFKLFMEALEIIKGD